MNVRITPYSNQGQQAAQPNTREMKNEMYTAEIQKLFQEMKTKIIAGQCNQEIADSIYNNRKFTVIERGDEEIYWDEMPCFFPCFADEFLIPSIGIRKRVRDQLNADSEVRSAIPADARIEAFGRASFPFVIDTDPGRRKSIHDFGLKIVWSQRNCSIL